MTKKLNLSPKAKRDQVLPGQTKAGVRAERDYIAAILETSDPLIVVLDGDGRIHHMSPSCETLTGYTLAELKGQLFAEVCLAPANSPAKQQKGTAPESAQQEKYWLTKDGRRRLIAYTTTQFSAGSHTEFTILTGTDITERKQTTLLLKASESLQRVTTALLQHLTTVEDVLAIICTEACRLTGAAGSAVLLLDDETTLQVKSSCGHPLPVLSPLNIEDTFGGQVITQRTPLLLQNSARQKHAYDRNPALKTMLAVPLCVDESILGVLDVVNKPGGFTDTDIRLMHLFADQAAISIEHALLHEQAERLAVIEERQRLARELHDSVTQAIYSITLYADAARMALASGKQDVAADHLQELRHMAREAIMDMRLLIFELHPPVLEKEGLATAVQTRLETVEARSGLQSAFSVTGKEQRLPLFIEEDLYRIVQEALNNAVKHAHAQQVSVHLFFADHFFRVEVTDDGIGFDPGQARQSGGVGLRSIEERTRRIGGKLQVESSPDAGTALKVEVYY